MSHVAPGPGEEIVQADHLGVRRGQAVAQVASQEPGSAGDEVIALCGFGVLEFEPQQREIFEDAMGVGDLPVGFDQMHGALVGDVADHDQRGQHQPQASTD